MSYNRNRHTDPLNNYFTNLIAFVSLSNKLLESNDEDEFEMWFSKLSLIDPRALYISIKQNQNDLPKDYIESAKWHFNNWGLIW